MGKNHEGQCLMGSLNGAFSLTWLCLRTTTGGPSDVNRSGKTTYMLEHL